MSYVWGKLKQQMEGETEHARQDVKRSVAEKALVSAEYRFSEQLGNAVKCVRRLVERNIDRQKSKINASCVEGPTGQTLTGDL